MTEYNALYMYTCRYLLEECLEVQVWASVIKRGKHSGSQRPLADDTLIGSAYILLSDLISAESIGGSYPLFKAGVDCLGGQTIHMEIRKTILSGTTPTHESLAHTGSCVEVLVCSMYCTGCILSLCTSGVK